MLLWVNYIERVTEMNNAKSYLNRKSMTVVMEQQQNNF